MIKFYEFWYYASSYACCAFGCLLPLNVMWTFHPKGFACASVCVCVRSSVQLKGTMNCKFKYMYTFTKGSFSVGIWENAWIKQILPLKRVLDICIALFEFHGVSLHCGAEWMQWLQVKQTQGVNLQMNISFLWAMSVSLIEILHIKVCAALCCISQSRMLCAAIGCAVKSAVYCAVRGGGFSISTVLSHSTSVVSRTSGRAEPHIIQGYSILQMTLLRGGRGRGEKNKCWGAKGRTTEEDRLRGEERHRRSTSGKWKDLRSHSSLLEDHCSCTKSVAVRPTPAEPWLGETREKRKNRSELRSWSHHSAWAGMGTPPKASQSEDQTSHGKKSVFGPSLRARLFRGGKNTGKERVIMLVSESWNLRRALWLPHCWERQPPWSSSQVLPHTCLLLVHVFSACTSTARQLNTLMVDAKGRNMKCLTFFLMLPESVKNKSSKSSKKGNASGSSKLPPVCYEIITLRSKKKKKMAADIFPTKKPASTTTVQQYQQQNLNNNNTIQNCNWQGLYSTIRER